MNTGFIRNNNALRIRHRAACLLASTAIALFVAAVTPPLTPAIAQSNASTISISIPAQPLASAVEDFIAQSGWQVSYVTSALSGLESNAVSGTLQPESALRALVAGTGVDVTISGPGVAALIASAPAEVAAGEGELGYVLDTLYVTGEKVGRDYFSTYTSVGVVTADDLDTYNVTDVEDAFDALANVRATPSSDGEGNITIRGMNAEGVTQPDRNAPIISMLVDGSFQNLEAMRRGARSLWDVEQIEVLRGPQSTLQGRNSLGGTVIVETKDPTWEYEVLTETTISTEGQSTALAVSGPILEDQLAFRVSAQIANDKNGITYTDPDMAALGEGELQDFRAKLLFEPDAIPELSALLTFSHSHDKPSWNAVTGPDYFDRVYDSSLTTAEFRDTTVDRYVADVSYELTPDWTVRSVTALSTTYTTIDAASPTSVFGYDAVFNRDDVREGSDFTQDLTFTYDAPDSPFSGVFGLYAGQSTMHSDSSIYYDLYSSGVVFWSPVVQDTVTDTTTTSYAAYADMRYEAMSGVTLLGGGRLLQDTMDTTRTGEVLDLYSITYTAAVSENASVTNVEFLPKLGVAFDLSETQTIAFTATKGYRTGFMEAAPGEAVARTIEPEYLWDYEASYRSKWLDDALELNGNVFYYDYTNQQVVTELDQYPGQTTTTNSAKSRAYGLEIEGRYKATTELALYASLGLMRTEFLDTTIDGTDVSGNSFPDAPGVTAGLGAIYKHESGFFAGAQLSYTDGFYSTGAVDNDPSRYVDAYTVVDAQVGYEAENFKVTLFAENLFDAQYLTSIGSSGNEATVGEGRTIGVTASAKF